jgi:adenine-specific DNA-methyltransferase
LPKSPYGSSLAHCLDAHTAAKQITCDITYLDPPYNQHSYRGNYHIWETLVCNDKPDVYGRANKRTDCRTKKSPFNKKVTCKQALKEIIDSLSSSCVVISFNDEGFISREEMEDMLNGFGQVKTFEVDYKRYVGAQIGIYNKNGVKVGDIKKLRNKEFLYVMNRS